MNGEFPVLKPGANAISWTGTVTRVVVRLNWRFYNGFHIPKFIISWYI